MLCGYVYSSYCRSAVGELANHDRSMTMLANAASLCVCVWGGRSSIRSGARHAWRGTRRKEGLTLHLFEQCYPGYVFGACRVGGVDPQLHVDQHGGVGVNRLKGHHEDQLYAVAIDGGAVWEKRGEV